MNGRKMCVIGGGNIGAYVAVCLKKYGFKTNMYVQSPEKLNKELSVYDGDKDKVFSEEIDLITNDIKEALEDVSCVFITYPAFLFPSLANLLESYISSDMTLCFLPGTGGVEFAFKNCIDKGVKIFGLQRVPVIARYKDFGRLVYVSGKKSCLYLGSINANTVAINEFSNFLVCLFETKCEILSNYLCVTLTPSNPILHTARLYTMFNDYHSGIYYPRNFLFYEEWTNESSEELIKCDSELQKLCSNIKELDLASVISLPLYYESEDSFRLTNKIKSIEAFKGIKSPMIECENGWIPDLKSRYFTADFPYGLKIIIDIAKLFLVDTPELNKLWNWFCNLSGAGSEIETFCLQLSKEDFLKIYTN